MYKPRDLNHDPKSAPRGLSRRQLLPLMGATAASAIILPSSLAAAPADTSASPTVARARFVYVGTYTFPGTAPGGTHQSQAKGIYVFRLNPNDGGLKPIQTVETPNPSYLAFHPRLPRLYCVNEMTAGAVSSFAVNPVN